ncbi:DUF998 domain-containing protein [Brevundimonas sp. NIBR11]|uniref:DUF998 domain-containing protein n=1 Tax=Brevundimonas sp. NIBR11 TaxID=3015999 RepID=UPI0022F00CE5|nr:DUF998 domain-containing protein [Brevundimonas sp. NIBR11]WGM31644.1 hypothetical protein KKHFBJBL_01891 [Brevundimonas sp. NIBR11]
MRFVDPRWRQAARALLLVGVAAPIFALAAVLIAAFSYAGFDHARQYLSELGGQSAAYPWIFNYGVLIAGVMTGVAGLGFGLAVVILTRSPLSAFIVGLLFVLAGLGLVMSSLYPWPDPRHMAINMGLGIQLAPVFLLFALRQSLELTRLKRFLLVVFVFMAVLTVLTKHLVFPGTVNDFNVGYWERAFAIVLVGWVGVAAHLMRRALPR